MNKWIEALLPWRLRKPPIIGAAYIFRDKNENNPFAKRVPVTVKGFAKGWVLYDIGNTTFQDQSLPIRSFNFCYRLESEIKTMHDEGE